MLLSFQLTLNQRVTGSSPVAPTINLLKIILNPKLRWEPAASYGIFGKLLGTSAILTARRAKIRTKSGHGGASKGIRNTKGGAHRAPPFPAGA
jgi:hypothetical protein